MPGMHISSIQPTAPAVQPGLPVLRGANHPAPWHTATPSQRNSHTQASSLGRLGSTRPQRSADPRTGQRTALRAATAYWPGIHFGVRGPTQDETPLSWEEVQHGLAHHVFGRM